MAINFAWQNKNPRLFMIDKSWKRRRVEAAPAEIVGLLVGIVGLLVVIVGMLVVQGAWVSLEIEKRGDSSWRLLKVKMRAAKTEKPARKPMSAGLALGE